MDSSMNVSETQDEKSNETPLALVFPMVANDDHNTDSSDVSINDGDVEEPLIVHTSKPSGSRFVEVGQQSSTPRLLTFNSDSEDTTNKDDFEMGTEALEEFIAQRKTITDQESDHDTNKSEEGEGESDDESESSESLIEEAPGMESLNIDMETSRQRALREMAAYDRIGKKHLPAAETPFDLIDKLQKRKDNFVNWAKMRREPFEKFQDFDAFIDEITVTNDQSWKDVEIVREEEDDYEDDDYDEMYEPDD